MSRCDSAAIVPNTSELLPEPETPVNTVRRRFGISTLRSLRLLTRAPCTRITSWLSAPRNAGDCESVLVAMRTVSPTGRRSGLRDADEIARGVTERAVSRAPWLGRRLLEHLGAGRADLLERRVEVVGAEDRRLDRP